MLKKLFAILIALTISNTAAATIQYGDIAPKMMGKDTYDKIVNLKDYMGKIIVLEWTNHQCPYVRKHYETSNMQKLQQYAKDNGIIWISVVSSAKGKEGYTTTEEANKIVKDNNAIITHKILDTNGKIARAYGVQTTPHMFVIDKNGKIAYSGAIDDQPSTKHSTVIGAKNYVMQAIDELLIEKEVSVKNTNPYGCSIKY